MSTKPAYKIFICVFAAGLALYGYIDKGNELTELRRLLPVLEKEVAAIKKENIRFQYEIDRFESPIHLMELLRKPEFSHLKYPSLSDVLIISKNGEEDAD